MATDTSDDCVALPATPANRIDAAVTDSQRPIGGRAKSPYEHLAIALSLGFPAKQEGKIACPMTTNPASCDDATLMATRVLKAAVERSQSIEEVRQNMREEL